ncbi:MAG: amino acid--tRNA ligase-related protein [Patescibacteria group bacterium]|jgi:aspartyl-tRNA synthetase
MERILIKDIPKFVGQNIEIRGWVSVVRKLGKMAFLDIRDFTGSIQVFVDKLCVDRVLELKPEYVVALQAKVNERPAGQVKKENGDLGRVELSYQSHHIYSEALTPPFEIDKDSRKVQEELRMTHRYLDLRTTRMTKNIRLRDSVFSFVRQFLHEQLFAEIETPYLTKGTPEGAREYIVPSRNFPGKFYVLPQSPQQFKQLLMVSGFERYFQIVRCFRDEDQRGDRQPEFTQIDIEMSFVEVEDVLAMAEKMLVKLVKTLMPEKHFTAFPFPRMTYAEAMKTHGSDKPDIRKNKEDADELGFCFVTDFPLFEYSETEKKLVAVHHLFTSPRDEDMHLLDTEPEKVIAKQYDIALNGFEVAGGSIRIHDQKLQKKIFAILGLSEQEAHFRFGHMLEAFSYGVPPHGGIAFGADRLIALFAGETNIREVMAFPKTSDARDLLMGAPTDLSEDQLKDVHISISKKKK